MLAVILGSFIVLALIVFIFHLIVFGLKRRFIHVLASILISNWILAFLLVVQGLFYVFNAYTTLLLIFLIVFALRKRLEHSIGKLQSRDLDIIDVIATVFFFVFLVLLFKNVFVRLFSSDTFRTYLPLGRIIVQENRIPAFHLQNNMNYFFSVFPLLPSLIAFLFSFFGSFSEFLAVGIPVFYSTLTFFIIWGWARERGGLRLALATIVSVMTSAFLFEFGVRVFPESVIVFYATSAFYLLSKYQETRRNIFLAMTFMPLSLFSISKFSGVIFLLPFFIYLYLSGGLKGLKKTRFTVLLALAPLFLWTLWTVYNYGDPFFPYLSHFGFLKSKYVLFHKNISCNYYLINYVPVDPILFLKDVLADYPFFALAILYPLVRRRDNVFWLVFFSFALFISLNLNFMWPDQRHIFFLIGVLSVYSGETLIFLIDRCSPRFLKDEGRMTRILFLAVYYLFFYVLIVSKLRGGFPHTWWVLLCVLAFLLAFRALESLNVTAIFNEKIFSSTFVLFLILTPIFLFVIGTPGDFPMEYEVKGTLNFIRDTFSPNNFKVKMSFDSPEWRILNFLRNTENDSNFIISGESSNILVWYGNYTVLPFESFGFIYLNRGGLDSSGGGIGIYDELRSIGVDYVYDNEKNPLDCVRNVFSVINDDKEHFTLVFEEGNYRLWRLIP